MVADELTVTSRRSNAFLVIIGWALLGAFVVGSAYLKGIEQNVRLFQVGYAVGFIGYGLLVYGVCRRQVAGRWGVWLVGCVLVRAALLQTAPGDDLNRYLWEGRVQLAGHNPFVVPPDDPSLSSLRDETWAEVSHRDYTTIYPPLAQAEFLAVAAIVPSVKALKVVHVAFDLAAVALLGAWLKKLGRPPQLAIVYGLCPLTLTAFAIEGHVDALMIALLVGAGLADAHRRPYLCAGLLAGGILAKLVPIVLLAWLARKHGRAVLFALAVVAVGYLPYASAGTGLFDSVLRFVGTTQMLGLGHSLLSLCLDGGTAQWVCALLLIGVIVWCVMRRDALDAYALAVCGAVILLAPIVHFWYVTWVLIFLAFAPRVSWLVLAGAMVFYFEGAAQRSLTGAWALPPWVPFAVYAPFVVAWAVERLVRPRPVMELSSRKA